MELVTNIIMNETKQLAVYYHDQDLDGYMSGVIANYYLTARGHKVDCIGINYGDDFLAALPQHRDVYDEIYVLDVCDERLFKELGPKIHWIDHHEPAQAIMPPVKSKYYINGVAACRLTLRYLTDVNYMFDDHDFYYFRSHEREPWCVTLAGEYDIWDKNSPLAERLNYGIDLTFSAVEYLFTQTKQIYGPSSKSLDIKLLADNKAKDIPGQNFEFLNYIISKGEGAISFIKQFSKKIKGVPVTVQLEKDDKIFTLKGLGFNTHVNPSMMHNQGDEDFIFSWCYNGGNKVRCSFRTNKKDVDVSLIACQYGGNGHRKAAGCQMHIADFAKLLQVRF